MASDMFTKINEDVAANQESALKGTMSKLQGDSAKRMADFEAGQMMRNAKAIEAAGIRDANTMALRGDIMMSNAKARMAAGGGSTTDAAAVEYGAGVETNKNYNMAAAVYGAKTRANNTRGQAAARYIEGDIAQREGNLGVKQMFMIKM